MSGESGRGVSKELVRFHIYIMTCLIVIKGIKRGLIKKKKCRRLEPKQPKKESRDDSEVRALLLVSMKTIVGRATSSSGQPLPRKMAQRFKISPTTVLIITLAYMGGVVLLHIFSKITGN